MFVAIVNVIITVLIPKLIVGLDKVNDLLQHSLDNTIQSRNSEKITHRNLIEENNTNSNMSIDCKDKNKKRRTCKICQHKFDQDICTYSTCRIGATEETVTSDCTCEIKIGERTCNSCSYCGNNHNNEISFAYDCGDFGESQCCFEKNNYRTCTFCQDLNEQQLCTYSTCPLPSENSQSDNDVASSSSLCTCKIIIGNFECDKCEYCDNTLTKFEYDCGIYGKNQCA